MAILILLLFIGYTRFAYIIILIIDEGINLVSIVLVLFYLIIIEFNGVLLSFKNSSLDRSVERNPIVIIIHISVANSWFYL